MWKYTACAVTETHSQARPERPACLSDWIRQPVSSPWRTAASFW